ncbi:hypothetical protein AFAEC_1128 [Aliarcobacter faecis]|uniref:hypothetical protein n=1 Tax=Aliarcobacter faecis TaxID=1564138 RepID=UPI0004792BFD|nr:hypothetical protein [Aliarcobacter faecis]QKF73277.1 hypothetical protein AFAEC_1111 [Aliarcobacter faecis]QKF73294.1 hypothetical protein AFAEC_1128 [Aliarcobacter faecis]
MSRLYFKQNEILVLNAMCELVQDNIENEKKINISAFTIAKRCGISYNAVRRNIKRLMELKK